MSDKKYYKAEVVEDADLFTTRLKVPGGWIYRSYDKTHQILGMAFVPCPPYEDENDDDIPASFDNGEFYK